MSKEPSLSDIKKSIRQKLIQIQACEPNAEGLEDLKRLIHLQLTESGLQSKVRNAVSRHSSETNSTEGKNKNKLKKDELHSIIKKEGMIDEVLNAFNKDERKDQKFSEKTPTDGRTSAKLNPLLELLQNYKENRTVAHSEENIMQESVPLQQRTSGYCLRLKINQGKAFVEYLLEPSHLTGEAASCLTLTLYFLGQRFQSRPTPAVCDPTFTLDVKFHLHKSNQNDQLIDPVSLLAISEPVHVILVKTHSTGNRMLISSHFIEWRHILGKSNSKTSIPVELPGIGVENKIPAGMLEVDMQLIPPLITPLKENQISAQLCIERNRKTERDRLFLSYAKLWWREFIDMRPEHMQRLVKIFAQDENAVVRPVFSYVHPLTAERFLETPQEAAWFVSLFSQYSSLLPPNVDRTKHEQWNNLLSFLCIKEGDCEDHAVLLCSLLLGFGLDAYVCLGMLKKGMPSAWVATIGRSKQVYFWDSLTATRYHHKTQLNISQDDDDLKYPYKTIGCMFNDKAFYANCQPTDAVELCCFDLEDSGKWKAMSREAVELVSSYIVTIPPFLPSSLNSIQASSIMEEELKLLIAEHRMEKKLSTFWDENLCRLLSPALANYEYQGKTGVLSGDEDFHDAIYKTIPEGHTFKALPLHFLHRNARKAFTEVLRNPLGKEVVLCQGDMVRVAVRVRIYTYLEDVISTWVMIAVKYKPVL